MKNTTIEIFQEQTRLLYINSMLPIIISVVAAALLSWSLHAVIGQAILIRWFVVFFIISVGRILLLFLFSNEGTEQKEQEHWHRRFLISTYAIAAVWGAASFFMFPEHSLSHQIVFFMIMLGMAAGAVSSLCPSLPVVMGFLSFLLIPLIAKMAIIGNAESLFNASLVLMFWAVTVIGAIKIIGNIRENIELHLHSVSREKILKVSEERYRHIFSHAPLGIFHYDAKGVIIDCNEEFVSLLHSSKELLVGLNMPVKLKDQEMLIDNLANEMSRSRRHNHYGALLFIDLDNFKTINDSLGHSIGDELLKVVARRINENIRKEDTSARMGGDEFIIIATELDPAIGLAAYKARGIADKLSSFLSTPCQIEGHSLHITPSIGISIFPAQDKGVDDILKQADSAMYRAKDAGRNSICFFLPHMQEAADERLRLNMEIRTAIENDELDLHYQPQVDLSGELLGAEALIRWNHPEWGLILPGKFLEVAEETGLMHDISQWVLRKACRQIKDWTDTEQLKGSQTISINISGKEIAAPGYVDTVISILEETGADASCLGIELTEGSLVPTGEDIVEKIMTLREMGIKFSVNDFGTGYSSLSYLKMLPLNTLKIDRSFVNDIKDGSQDVVLVDTIISMANSLGLEVIAEGVETEQELLYLNARGCNVFQGFYFSKPVPAAIFTEMFASKKIMKTNQEEVACLV